MYKKCGFEKLPPLKTRALRQDGCSDVCGINTSREFFLVVGDVSGGGEAEEAEEAEPIPPEELMRAYRCVPASIVLCFIDDAGHQSQMI